MLKLKKEGRRDRRKGSEELEGTHATGAAESNLVSRWAWGKKEKTMGGMDKAKSIGSTALLPTEAKGT